MFKFILKEKIWQTLDRNVGWAEKNIPKESRHERDQFLGPKTLFVT